MKYDIPAVLFAGGKSSRMGKDKTLLPFANCTTLSEFQYSRLNKYFKEVYLLAKEDKFDFTVPVITDNYPQSSPLVGLVSMFESLNADKFFVLSVDAPFVNEKVIASLLAYNKKYDAVIAKGPNGIEPLCGLYRRSILPLAKKNLEVGDHRLNNLLKEADTQFIVFEDASVFTNLNHPHEYEDALKRITP